MGSLLSTQKPSAQARKSQIVGSAEQAGKSASHRHLEEFLSGSNSELIHFPFRTEEELGKQVHQAISQKDMDLLRFLINYYKAPLEESNGQGMTPLYNAVFSDWPEGALFLLKHGADVKNAERMPQVLCCTHEPLLYLALKTYSQPLLTELTERGISIRCTQCIGQIYLESNPFPMPNVLFRFLAAAVTEQGSRRPDQLKDLLFVISIGGKYPVDHREVEDFIKSQHSCHQSKMFHLFAACLCNRYTPDFNLALQYWRMSAECTPCQLHDHTVEEETIHRSVFADIIDVKEHPLPDTVMTDDEMLAIQVHALLAIEQYMPDDDHFLKMSRHVHVLLLQNGQLTAAVEVLQRFTTIRALSICEVEFLQVDLRLLLRDLEDVPEIPVAVFMDFMKTIEKCLASLIIMCSDVHKDKLEPQFERLFELLLQAIIKFCDNSVRATPDQFRHFTSHVKDIVRLFPWTLYPNTFHRLSGDDWQCPSFAPMIQMLVACSAEVFSTIRMDSPPHLQADVDGNTPLHTIALFRSREELVQKGVLQCFLDHGADLCTKNNQGETVRSILVRCGVCTEGELLPSLQCLAAAAFMRNGRLRQNVGNCRPAAVRYFLLDHQAK